METIDVVARIVLAIVLFVGLMAWIRAYMRENNGNDSP